MKKIITILALTLLAVPYLYSRQSLKFSDGKFRIAQFTDLHWMPESADNCSKTERVIRHILATEKPDVAVLTGDVIYGQPAENAWKHIVEIFEEEKMPFVVTMGNHDAEFLDKKSIYAILEASEYYVGEAGPEHIKGYGNCAVPVYSETDGDKVEGVLYCLDSNDVQPNRLYGSYDWIHFDQILWYRELSKEFAVQNGGKPIPSLAFFHIPLIEYAEIEGDDKTMGNKKENYAPAGLNTGMFASFIDKKDVMGIFVGHDHDNDLIGINKGIAMAYGRVTGTDAYGELERGARMIEMYEGEFRFDSWITTLKGREATYYFPSGFNSLEEETMEYLPSLPVNPSGNGVAYTYYEGDCETVSDIPACRVVEKGVMNNLSIKNASADDHFAYEFRSFIRIPERGVYRFYTYSDDGSVLYIDNQIVVDNDGGHSVRHAEGKAALEAGFHELKLLYFEDYMGEELEVGFSSKNIRETVLPDSLLFLAQ